MGTQTTPAAGRAPQTILRLLAGATLTVSVLLVPQTSDAADSEVALTFDKDAFLASQPIVSTEDFNEFPTPTEYPPTQRRVVIDSVRYRSAAPGPPSWVIDIIEPATPDNALTRRFNSGSGEVGRAQAAVAFRDGKSVPAVGFMLRPFSTSNQFELIVTEGNGTVTSFMLPARTDATYIGVSSPDLIKRVFITQHPEVTGSVVNFALDDVSRGHITRPL